MSLPVSFSWLIQPSRQIVESHPIQPDDTLKGHRDADNAMHEFDRSPGWHNRHRRRIGNPISCNCRRVNRCRVCRVRPPRYHRDADQQHHDIENDSRNTGGGWSALPPRLHPYRCSGFNPHHTITVREPAGPLRHPFGSVERCDIFDNQSITACIPFRIADVNAGTMHVTGKKRTNRGRAGTIRRASAMLLGDHPTYTVRPCRQQRTRA